MFSSSSNLRRSFIGDSRTARAQHDNVMAALASRAGFEAGSLADALDLCVPADAPDYDAAADGVRRAVYAHALTFRRGYRDWRAGAWDSKAGRQVGSK